MKGIQCSMHEQPLNEIKIEVTYQCPLRCSHCSSDASPGNSLTMDNETCMRIIEDAKSLGATKIAFSGGEPLVWENICSVVDFSANHGMNTTIYTSGNVENPDRIFKKLYTSGLDKAVFSIYAPDSYRHELVTRTSGSLDKTIAAIRCCNDLKIKTELHFVATAQNYHLLPDICTFMRDNSISSMSILRFVPQGRGKLLSKAILSKRQNAELVHLVHEMRSLGFNIRTGSPMNVFYLNEDPRCLAAIDRVIVAPDLRIYPCDAFKQIEAEQIVGTIKNSSIDDATLIECWHASPYLYKIRDVLSADPIGSCSKCPNINKCNTGCLAQKFLTYGKLERSQDPACMMQ